MWAKCNLVNLTPSNEDKVIFAAHKKLEASVNVFDLIRLDQIAGCAVNQCAAVTHTAPASPHTASCKLQFSL